MKSAKNLLYIFIGMTVLMLCACARIVKPPGGEKDTIAPQVLESKPHHKSVNFDGNKIIIEFNEFIKIDDIENQLVISPILDPKPDIYMKGKKLVIRLNAPLSEESTYNFNFGDALKDITEGNPLSNFQYTVATGAVLDSMSISGKAIDAFTGEGSEEMWVLLYKESSDTTFRKRKPDYIAKTRDDGTFVFNGLPNINFEIYALDDQNSNLIYDLPNEKIAFLDSVIKIDTSNIYDILLNTFVEKEDKAMVTGIKQTGYSSFTINYSEYVENSSISTLEGVDISTEMHNSGEKEIVWLKATSDSSMNLIIQGDDIVTDTSRINFSRKFTEKPDTLFTVKEAPKLRGGSTKIQATGPILINFSNPIEDIGAISLFDKGIPLSISDLRVGENPRSISFTADLEDDMAYKALFTKSPMDIYGNELPPTDSILIETMGDEDFSQFILETTNYDSSANYIAGLYTELNPNTLIQQIELNPDTITIVERIFPGKYYFIVYDDKNSNKTWDKGSYDDRLLSEKTWSISKQLHFKGKFEVESSLDLN